MTKKQLIDRILDEFLSMNLAELTQAEWNIMSRCLWEGKLEMDVDQYNELQAPRPRK